MSTVPYSPLAERLRPQTIAEVVGQEHLLGKGKPLSVVLERKQVPSMILWGPPGVGKTSLARLMASHCDYELLALSAVFSGVRDIRTAIAQAEQYRTEGRRTLLFVDEIHRFNKVQQDALLPYTENGVVTFVGATTENPSFEVNGALLSRAQVYVLRSLKAEDLRSLLDKALRRYWASLSMDSGAIDSLIAYADGDVRRLWNGLEQVLHIFGGSLGGEEIGQKERGASHTAETDSLQVNKQSEHGKQEKEILPRQVITAELATEALGLNTRRFDKGGDYFYDQISALHKSVRGSHPDAALYWLCRMLDGGADPRYLSRRIVRMAWEDIGLADPRAIQLANDAAATYERLGSPEGELALGQAVIYLAVAAKSNAGYRGFKDAMAFVRQDRSREVPVHLRNAPTELMKEMGHGRAYRYAHDEPDAYAAGERYLPEDMPDVVWYQPVERGLEKQIAQKMAFLRDLDREEAGKIKEKSALSKRKNDGL